MSNETMTGGAETAAHTPGPWRYDAGHIKADVGFLIADIRLQANATIANARLIAAAPDMLAALDRLVNASMFKDHPGASQMAIDAIAKATGGAQ